jgi:hypothetical protein
MPGSNPGVSGSVLLMNAEDALDDTVGPRLDNLGADSSRVVALVGVRDARGERWISLVTDLAALEVALQSNGEIVAAIIDPLNAYLGTGLDTHRDAPLRSVLGPLAAMANKYDVAVIAVMHINKGNSSQPLYRVIGSIAYVAAARSVLVVGRDPEDERSPIRHVVAVKHSLAESAPPSLKFELRQGRLLWAGESRLTARQLLAPPDGETRSSLDEAIAVLEAILADGSQPTKEVERLALQAGVSKRTLERARAALGVKSAPLTEPGRRGAVGWRSSLPTDATAINSANSANREHLADLIDYEFTESQNAPQVGGVNPTLTGAPRVPRCERHMRTLQADGSCSACQGRS